MHPTGELTKGGNRMEHKFPTLFYEVARFFRPSGLLLGRPLRGVDSTDCRDNKSTTSVYCKAESIRKHAEAALVRFVGMTHC